MDFKVSITLVLACLSLMISTSDGYRILGLFPHPAVSHFNFFEPVMKGLAKAGHEVVVVSPFPQKQSTPNYVDIKLNVSHMLMHTIDLKYMENRPIYSHPLEFFVLYDWSLSACESVFATDALNIIINDKKGFDIILMEQFNTDCLMAIAWKLDLPVIAFASSALMPWHYERHGLPLMPSHIPALFSYYNEVMSYPERMYNYLITHLMRFMYRYYIDSTSNEIVRKYLGDKVPDVAELAKSTSLVFLNQHYSLSGVKPLTPGVIEIGGVHINPDSAEEIDAELQRILDNAENGVIYVSWGSMIKSESLPEPKRNVLLQAFGSLKQTVLWKFENENIQNLPKNVFIRKWMPQQKIMCHPKVRVFMTHSGLLGSSEAAYCGVPVVTTPIIGDQYLNAAALVYRGMAVQLNLDEITDKTIVLKAIHTALGEEYRENARKVSRSYRDRLMSPIDTAVWWVEHIVKTGGDSLNKSASIGMPWYIYYSLDVILTFITAFTICILSWVWVIKRFCGSSSSHSQRSPEKRKVN